MSIALLGWDCGLIWAKAEVTEAAQLGLLANQPACRETAFVFNKKCHIISTILMQRNQNCWACLKFSLGSLFYFWHYFFLNKNVIVTACWKCLLYSWCKNAFPVLCVHFEYNPESRSDSWCLCNRHLTRLYHDESVS